MMAVVSLQAEEYTNNESDSAFSFCLDSRKALGQLQMQAQGETRREESPPKESIFRQGDESLPAQQFGASYTAPGNYSLRDCHDFFVTGSYLYWNPKEDGLDIALSAATDSAAGIFPTNNGRILFENNQFNSGFKVGFGTEVNADESLVYFEYTRFRGHASLSKAAPSSSIGTGIWYLTSWFFQPTPGGQAFATSKVFSKWDVSIDWIDGLLSRPSYLGRSFIFTPFAGLRASRIHQRVNVKARPLNATPEQEPAVSRNSSTSYGLGPKMGVDLSWLLGRGFKLIGELGAEILYTKYSTRHSETAISTANGFVPVSLAINNYQTLRLGFETKLGLGWGSYLRSNRRHLDFAVFYDLNYLCNENVLRNMIDTAATGSSDALGDLHIQGLTAMGRFDF